MRSLRQSLDDMNFAEILTVARAMLPKVAPRWTDHNLHDPGITLIELMAHVADQQIYGLGRSRYDERLAYAGLVGVRQSRARPATGLLWPVMPDPPRLIDSIVIKAGTRASVDHSGETPPFKVRFTVYFTPAKIAGLDTCGVGGRVDTHLMRGAGGARGFQPFGAEPVRGTRFIIALDGPLMSKAARSDTRPTLSIGVMTEDRAKPTQTHFGGRRISLAAFLISGRGEDRLEIIGDGTDAFRQTGALRLDLSRVAPSVLSDENLKLAFELRTDLPLAPYVSAIAFNVLDVVQEDLERFPRDGSWVSTGLPDQEFLIDALPISDDEGAPAIQVRVDGKDWKLAPSNDLRDAKPDDDHFVFDETNGTVAFGNGVNGAIPPRGSTVEIQCVTSAGAAGNLSVSADWSVEEAPLTFRSKRAMQGGKDQTSLRDMRRDARSLLNLRPLITDGDLINAALRCDDLKVARAHVLTGHDRPRRRERRLVAVQRRDGVGVYRESAAWLNALHARLSSQLPLGDRLCVTGPNYIPLRIKLTLAIEPDRDPKDAVENAQRELERRFAPIAADERDARRHHQGVCSTDKEGGWPLGRGVRAADIMGWLRKMPGIAAIRDLAFVTPAGATSKTPPPIPRDALPELKLAREDVTAVRLTSGARR